MTIDSLDNAQSNAENKGGIYFSYNNGSSWDYKSRGLPDNFTPTDIAVTDNLLGIVSKDKGIYLYDFQKDSWYCISTNLQTPYNLDVLFFYKGNILVGSQDGGICMSNNQGKTWDIFNKGLKNLTIRKLELIGSKLYAGTNGGLYSLNELENTWELVYGHGTMQVNGITYLDGEIYIGTNMGVFKTLELSNKWKQILSDNSLHNISSIDSTLYAMTYNKLLISKDKGMSWQNVQKGLPAELYTFNVVKNDHAIFAGQWDGIYKKGSSGNQLVSEIEWIHTSNNISNELAFPEMKVYKNIIVIGCSIRKLRQGASTNK